MAEDVPAVDQGGEQGLHRGLLVEGQGLGNQVSQLVHTQAQRLLHHLHQPLLHVVPTAEAGHTVLGEHELGLWTGQVRGSQDPV